MTKFTVPDAHAVRVGRVLKAKTQRELAEAIGVPPSRIAAIEAGLTMPKPEELRAIWCFLSS